MSESNSTVVAAPDAAKKRRVSGDAQSFTLEMPLRANLPNHARVRAFKELSALLKQLEQLPDDLVDRSTKGDRSLRAHDVWLARLDGHCFSTFVSGLAKPFDRRFAAAMRRTAADLLRLFPDAMTSYTHSDEITLVFPVRYSDDSAHSQIIETQGSIVERAHGGRIDKLNSLLAGAASARFNFHLQFAFDGVDADVEVANEAPPLPDSNPLTVANDTTVDSLDATLLDKLARAKYTAKTLAKMRGGNAIFDSRLFPVPEKALIRQNLLWRQQFDCRRNSVHGLARAFFSTKELNNVSVPNQIEKLRDEKGVDYFHADAQFRFGVLCKRQQYEIDAVDRKTNQPVKALRTRFAFCYRLMPFDDEEEQARKIDEFLLSKYLSD